MTTFIAQFVTAAGVRCAEAIRAKNSLAVLREVLQRHGDVRPVAVSRTPADASVAA